jgi:hypothetical protein
MILRAIRYPGNAHRSPAANRLPLATTLLVATLSSLGSGMAGSQSLPTDAAGQLAPDEPPDLSIGDISRYVDAARLAIPLPEALEEIIVWGRVPGTLPERRVMPQGLGAIAHAVTNPLQAWRILAPDPNLQIPGRSEDDLSRPPGSHRARILEPGRVYD